jgi:hypothetical protein
MCVAALRDPGRRLRKAPRVASLNDPGPRIRADGRSGGADGRAMDGSVMSYTIAA